MLTISIYLIVPSANSFSIPSEMNHIISWAAPNNLKLNPSKSCEIIFKKPRSRASDPPLTPGLVRVQSLKILGVTLQSNLSVSEHVDNLVSNAARAMYALKTLKSNGLSARLLSAVSSSTLVSSLTYASPSWSGFTSQEDCVRLQSVLNRASRWGLCDQDSTPIFLSLRDKADHSLFLKSSSPGHVLHQCFPPVRSLQRGLRPRTHNFTLPINSSLLKRNFIYRMLFKDAY